ncbi:hypothetical protein [Marinomonas epiphytica]
MISTGRFLLASYVSVLCMPSWAQELTEPDPNAQSEHSKAWWYSYHAKASSKVASWAGNIDDYLSGQESGLSEDSYARLRIGSTFKEEGEYSGFFDFKARLKLPNTQDRLRLIIESDGDTLTQDNLSGEASENTGIVDSALDSNIAAALRYAKEEWHADLDAGILLAFPLDPFIRLRLRQGDYKEGWYWQQGQEAFAYYSEGIGARYEVKAGHRLSTQHDIGASFASTWLDQENTLYLRENLYFFHQLNDKSAFTYQLSFLQEGKSSIKAESYLFFVDYQRKLFKNWLVGHVKPQTLHEVDNDFNSELSITLSLEVLLGQKYLNQ